MTVMKSGFFMMASTCEMLFLEEYFSTSSTFRYVDLQNSPARDSKEMSKAIRFGPLLNPLKHDMTGI